MDAMEEIHLFDINRSVLTRTGSVLCSNLLFEKQKENRCQIFDEEIQIISMLINAMRGIETAIISNPKSKNGANDECNEIRRFQGYSVITTRKLIQFFNNIFIYHTALFTIQNILMLMPSAYGYRSLANTVEQLLGLYDSSVNALEDEIQRNAPLHSVATLYSQAMLYEEFLYDILECIVPEETGILWMQELRDRVQCGKGCYESPDDDVTSHLLDESWYQEYYRLINVWELFDRLYNLLHRCQVACPPTAPPADTHLHMGDQDYFNCFVNSTFDIQRPASYNRNHGLASDPKPVFSIGDNAMLPVVQTVVGSVLLKTLSKPLLSDIVDVLFKYDIKAGRRLAHMTRSGPLCNAHPYAEIPDVYMGSTYLGSNWDSSMNNSAIESDPAVNMKGGTIAGDCLDIGTAPLSLSSCESEYAALLRISIDSMSVVGDDGMGSGEDASFVGSMVGHLLWAKARLSFGDRVVTEENWNKMGLKTSKHSLAVSDGMHDSSIDADAVDIINEFINSSSTTTCTFPFTLSDFRQWLVLSNAIRSRHQAADALIRDLLEQWEENLKQKHMHKAAVPVSLLSSAASDTSADIDKPTDSKVSELGLDVGEVLDDELRGDSELLNADGSPYRPLSVPVVSVGEAETFPGIERVREDERAEDGRVVHFDSQLVGALGTDGVVDIGSEMVHVEGPVMSTMVSQELYQEARSSILKKYAEKSREAERRLRATAWRQKSLLSKQHRVVGLLQLYTNDIKDWKKTLLGKKRDGGGYPLLPPKPVVSPTKPKHSPTPPQAVELEATLNTENALEDVEENLVPEELLSETVCSAAVVTDAMADLEVETTSEVLADTLHDSVSDVTILNTKIDSDGIAVAGASNVGSGSSNNVENTVRDSNLEPEYRTSTITTPSEEPHSAPSRVYVVKKPERNFIPKSTGTTKSHSHSPNSITDSKVSAYLPGFMQPEMAQIATLFTKPLDIHQLEVENRVNDMLSSLDECLRLMGSCCGMFGDDSAGLEQVTGSSVRSVHDVVSLPTLRIQQGVMNIIALQCGYIDKKLSINILRDTQFLNILDVIQETLLLSPNSDFLKLFSAMMVESVHDARMSKKTHLLHCCSYQTEITSSGSGGMIQKTEYLQHLEYDDKINVLFWHNYRISEVFKSCVGRAHMKCKNKCAGEMELVENPVSYIASFYIPWRGEHTVDSQDSKPPTAISDPLSPQVWGDQFGPAVTSFQELSKLQVILPYIPSQIDSILTKEVIAKFARVTTRLIEIYQLLSVAKLLWGECRSVLRCDSSNTDTGSGLYTDHSTKKLYFEAIRYCIVKLQALVDFCSDRIRVAESIFHEHVAQVNVSGIAGLILAVDKYAESLLSCCFVGNTVSVIDKCIDGYIEQIQSLLWDVYQKFFVVDLNQAGVVGEKDASTSTSSRSLSDTNASGITDVETVSNGLSLCQKSLKELRNMLALHIMEYEGDDVSEQLKSSMSVLMTSVCSDI